MRCTVAGRPETYKLESDIVGTLIATRASKPWYLYVAQAATTILHAGGDRSRLSPAATSIHWRIHELHQCTDIEVLMFGTQHMHYLVANCLFAGTHGLHMAKCRSTPDLTPR
jgi:hypothetical protein